MDFFIYDLAQKRYTKDSKIFGFRIYYFSFRRVMAVKTAIIPVAGMGTRMLPASKAQPKEMLPVVDKPVIQYIVEEAVEAGIENIIFVTAIGKRAIEDHFDRNFELEYRLEQKGKKDILKQVSSIGKLAKFSYVRQNKPLGDGHAVLTALPFVEKHEPVAVLFGDDIVDTKKRSGIGQLIDTYEKYQDPVIMVAEVPKKEVSKYGVIAGTELANGTWEISKFVEKPSVEKAPSNLAVAGRYVLSPEYMARLASTKPGKDGEIRLANAFVDHLKEGKPVYGQVLDGEWLGCGDKFGLIKASIIMGLRHEEVKTDLKKYLKSL